MTAPSQLKDALADRYLIERELGAGGMATVYLAQDVRHDRKVAVKVLRPELSAILGADRFLAEIKTTANLQHPHILPLHDSGEAAGLVFYVMPYIEGESLRDRLRREHQLPVDDAVRITREVADALDYAHRHKVIHRDIKPENILLHDGRALVADFGIALAVSRSDGGTRMTETGMSLGTPHYMSPEQAMGEREITAKSDVYALGCVLYELLTGEPPFTGPTAQAIIARVMTESPRSLTLQRRTIPPHVEAAVGKALQKLPADRFSSAAEFSAALANTAFAHSASTAATVVRPAWRGASRQQQALRALPWTLAVAGFATAAWVTGSRELPVAAPVTRFILTFGRGAGAADGTGSPIAFTPDGSRIAYVGVDSSGSRQLFLRALDRTEPVVVAGTAGADQPFFSPDGLWLGFRQDGKLRKVSLAGGAVVTICDIAGLFYGGSWGEGDVIVFSHQNQIKVVSAAGGAPRAVAVPDTNVNDVYRFPDVLPGARAALFTAVTDSGPTIRAVTLDNGAIKPLGRPGMSPHYVNGGWLSYTEQDGTLFAAPFDAGGLEITGPPQPITDNVRTGPAQVSKLGIARTGALAYLSGATALAELVLLDREGRATVLPTAPNRYVGPRFSPDGRRLVVGIIDFTRRSSGTNGGDLWVWDLAAKNFQRITFDTANSVGEWTPDGRRIVYVRVTGTRASLFSIRTDGSGLPESLLARVNPIFETSLLADGRRFVLRETDPQTGRDIWITSFDSLNTARPLLVTPFDERNPAVSPDGRWLAYASNETGAFEVYVRGLAEGSGRTRVSNSTGLEPRWSRTGRELYYRTNDSVFAVAVPPGPDFRPGTPRVLFASRYSLGNPTNWDISPDGRYFVVVRTPEAAAGGTPVNVVLHWFDQLAKP